MKFWCLENDVKVLILGGRELGLDCVNFFLMVGIYINFVIFVRGPYERFVA